ncbi:MAG: YjjG family noncanonical pyrimidine nucleotidase [Tannerella sp.]|jgi:putative hydrolase of the HAD superfamily|nr:YjjG family noncanonical pyrimidine nucleotidase [Tannerella sp.]
MNTRYKSIFFDLDDTLWDTNHNNRECLEEIFADYAFDRHYDSFETFYRFYMPHNMKLWGKYRNHEIDRQTLILERFLYVLRPMGIEDNVFVLRLNHDFLQRTATKTKLIPGAIELLEYLYPFYRLFILSNGFREIQALKLQNSNLACYFEKVILSEDANIQKPHKEIFDFALTNTNSRRNESLMIGDCLEADIEGAYHAKIDQLWYNPDNHFCKRIVPTFQVRTLGEIGEIL